MRVAVPAVMPPAGIPLEKNARSIHILPLVIGFIVLIFLPGVICSSMDASAYSPISLPTYTPNPAHGLIQVTQPPAQGVVKIAPAAGAETPAPADAAPAPPAPRVALTASDTAVIVRSGPGADFSLIGELWPGESAPITAISDDGQWWQIIFQDQPGWVFMSFAPVQGDTSTIAPIVQATPTEDIRAEATAMWERVIANSTAIEQTAEARLQTLNATSTVLAALAATPPASAPGTPGAH